ncbi:response regulator [Serpentinicella alkaliphila]|uniref:Circadian input-output histidine kinase CikA n=1 Tax=Serpentinicella alkaliphila TaxID=1734049 RepID=A0A4V2T3D9_9FIRM|nr:response regulator [Serpentinicella alkaliphila]QUH25399.1 response regulator [Serpentinicella alkaliphila]TCQ00604.1 signal transduction histidine kinase [Serpentinicella alkaliphila]
MILFNKLKLGTKVSIGFGLVLTLLLVSVITSIVGVRKISNEFSQFRQISNEEMLFGRLQENLLESRIAYENYVQLRDAYYKDVFEERLSKMEDFIYELKIGITDVERQMKMEYILEHSREYKNDFNRIVEYEQKRDHLYNELVFMGPQLTKILSEIMDTANNNNDEFIVYTSGVALKHLGLARLHVSRFLETDDSKMIDVVTNEFQEMEKSINLIEGTNRAYKYKDSIDKLKENKEAYYNSLMEISSVVGNRNSVIAHLDEIGPDISAIAEEMKLSIIEEQARYGPEIKKENQNIITRMSIILLLALLLSILISIRIVRMVISPVKTVTNTFKEISEGEADLEVRMEVNSSDELGEMARSFNKFMEKLQFIILESQGQNWLKTGQTELNEIMRDEQDLLSLSNNVINYIARYLDIQTGSIYIRMDDGTFKFHGGYAYTKGDNYLDNIEIGQGVIGQAAKENKSIILSNIKEHYLKIDSSVINAVPINAIILPCAYNNEVRCVIELGALNKFTEKQLKFLNEVSESIANSVDRIISRKKLQELLNKTLTQSEELQVQQEELRQSNEELEEQTNALKESEVRLQTQQEELRVTNEELIEHARTLEQQKNLINAKNENLIKARKEIEEKAKALETTSKYKSEFLANMSHELRTPLNSILVLSQLLSEKKDKAPLTEKQLEFASTIHAAGSELLRLINDVLDLSKVEAGKIDINFEMMNIQEFAKGMERTFGQIAEKKGLNFSVVVEEELPECIYTDSHRLQQIVNNFISNALKFTEKGEVVLRISYANDEITLGNDLKSKSFINIAVTDTGIGIPLDKQSVIFEPFKQSDGTTSRKYGGTGLGLSIAKELARLLGVSINLKSDDKGSTFSLLLPIVIDEDVAIKEVATSKEIEADCRSLSLHGINDVIIDSSYKLNDENKEDNINVKESLILIIEDDAKFSNVLVELAKSKGNRCIVASNGRMGIEMAKKKKPDAIILDLGLPDIDGLQVIEELRAMSEASSIPIHIVSGKEDMYFDSSTDGIIGYMLKPVSTEQIQQVFDQVERSFAKDFNRLLLVGIDEIEQKNIIDTIGKHDIKISSTQYGSEAIKLLKDEKYDCIISDLKLEDMSGFELLKGIVDEDIGRTPVIVYTDKSLSNDEAMELQKYTESIIIKGLRSIERLTGEVSLFLHRVASKELQNTNKMIRSSFEKEESLRGRRVLIVDDDMRNVFSLSSALEEKGIIVEVSRNGKEGLEKLKNNTDIDLILMDIMMPEMDGYTAIKAIRKTKNISKIPIIALTAKSMKEDRNKCIEAGANDYLTKPIEINRLLSLVRVWLY